MIISIDIGTSYSTLCFLNNEGKAEPVEIATGVSAYGDKFSLPSAVFADDDGTILVGQAALKQRGHKPQNFRAEFKRNLGQNVPIIIGGRGFLPEELYTELFRHMLSCLDNKFNESVDKAYITYPASLGATNRERIVKAAKDAGLFDIELIDEPSAAAMCYCADGILKENGIYMVYDFGGGTFDTALVQYENGKITPLGVPKGIEHCGGADIDRLIYADMLSSVPGEAMEQISQNKGAKIRFETKLAEMAVEIKHQLSSAESATEYIPVGFDDYEYILTRTRLNTMIAGMIEQTVDCCRGLLSANNRTVSDLSGIIMVGGTCRVPLVRDMLKKLAGDICIYAGADLELSVAQGAVVYSKVSGLEDYPEEIRDVVRLALLGDAEAQYITGGKYYDGHGVKKDYFEAFKWFEKSATQGFAMGQNGLGELYYYGEGTEQDYFEAFKWFVKSVEQEYVEAQYNLGMLYYYGHGTEQNYSEAFKWLKIAAEKGYANAQHGLAMMYYNGEGTEKNYFETFKWMKKAAEQGNADSQNGLGESYYHGVGTEQNYFEAFKWFVKSAEQEYVEAQYNLGMLYYYGHGTEQNYSEAFKWLKIAAEKGYANAQHSLAMMYYNGEGTEKNYFETFKWMKKAAEQGNADSQNALGMLYYHGEGVEQNYYEAFEWLKKSAVQGYMAAQYSLGSMYYYGDGVEENMEEALKWLKLSAEQGHSEALEFLDNYNRE